MEISTFTELVVWQKAMDLLVDVYAITARYLRSEMFGLTFRTEREGAIETAPKAPLTRILTT
jgi:23S rRNA-intervening sequence protein